MEEKVTLILSVDGKYTAQIMTWNDLQQGKYEVIFDDEILKDLKTEGACVMPLFEYKDKDKEL